MNKTSDLVDMVEKVGEQGKKIDLVDMVGKVGEQGKKISLGGGDEVCGDDKTYGVTVEGEHKLQDKGAMTIISEKKMSSSDGYGMMDIDGIQFDLATVRQKKKYKANQSPKEDKQEYLSRVFDNHNDGCGGKCKLEETENDDTGSKKSKSGKCTFNVTLVEAASQPRREL